MIPVSFLIDLRESEMTSQRPLDSNPPKRIHIMERLCVRTVHSLQGPGEGFFLIWGRIVAPWLCWQDAEGVTSKNLGQAPVQGPVNAFPLILQPLLLENEFRGVRIHTSTVKRARLL